jgi:diketogulonate reductase-like aldo/keto reductase
LLDVARVAPAVDQVEFHPWLQQPRLQAYLAEHDITLEAWAPLMKGHLDEEPALRVIGERHGVSAAQVTLRWILQMGYVAIPKSVHEERIRQNAELFEFELSDEEMGEIDALDRGFRFGPDPDTYAW